MRLWEFVGIRFKMRLGICCRSPYETRTPHYWQQTQIVSGYRGRSNISPVLQNGLNTRDPDAIDFLRHYREQCRSARTSPLDERALDKCEETFAQRDWSGFAYWHTVFLRERNRLNRAARLS